MRRGENPCSNELSHSAAPWTGNAARGLKTTKRARRTRHTNSARELHRPDCTTITAQGCPSVESMEPIAEDDKTQDAVEQTKHEYDSVAAQYSKMNRHASAEHVELLLAAMPRGVEEQRRRADAEALIPTLRVHIKELEDACLLYTSPSPRDRG